MSIPYAKSVFINCPFTEDYGAMFRALVFTVVDCGYRPRCALEIVDSGQIRLQKIETLIEQSKYGIHDLSNMALDESSGLPRFNMPLELGLFLGAKRFGEGRQKQKRLVILDTNKYRYQQSISDIAGQDIQCHTGDPLKAIRCVRNWLQTVSRRKTIDGAMHIVSRYKEYESALPEICTELRFDFDDLTFNDLWETMVFRQLI
ncbi:MAG: hypothetical protein COB92_05235 [Robiginitomaculum sp.]|nr:MAG: hypothetical protein COB92_05235 [Robiginitomaculum sp.]